MKTCKRCGKAMDATFNVCPYCGLAFVENYEEPQQDFQPQQEQMNNNPFSNQDEWAGRENAYNCGYNQQGCYAENTTGYTPAPRSQRSAYIAGILAIIGGMFGLHNFYLDNTKRGIMQLVISVAGLVLTFGVATIAMEVWAVTEGLKILKGEINTDGTGAMIKMGW